MYLLHSKITVEKHKVNVKIFSNWGKLPIVNKDFVINDWTNLVEFIPKEFAFELENILQKVGVNSNKEWEEVLKLRRSINEKF